MKDLLFGALGEGDFVFYRENKTLYKNIQELLRCGHNIALEVKSHTLFSRDAEDCDLLLFDALMYIASDRLKEASFVIQKNILELGRYHCHYHYLGYKTNYNIYLLQRHLELEGGAVKFFERANFLYSNNLRGRVEGGDLLGSLNCLKVKDSDFISNIKVNCIQKSDKLKDCNIFINSNFANLILKTEKLIDNNHYKQALVLLLEANDDLELGHFKYHCIMSLNFFIKSICCCGEGDLSSARYFLQKAQEQDIKNPLNKYFNIYSEKYLYA
jgi:hypothetical protein